MSRYREQKLVLRELQEQLRNDQVVTSETDRTLLAFDNNFKWLADSSINAVITDPPFNIARESNFHTYTNNRIHSYQLDSDKGWDTFSHDAFITELASWSSEFERVLIRGGSFVVFCADAYLSHLIDALKVSGLSPKRTFTWRKPNAVPVNRGVLPMSACEYIVWGTKPRSKATFNATVSFDEVGAANIGVEAAREIEAFLVADKVASVAARNIRTALKTAVLSGDNRRELILKIVEDQMSAISKESADRVAKMYTDEEELRGCVPNFIEHQSATGSRRVHPTEKPVGLLRYLVALTTRPGDIVLDPFSGSGSTGEAASSLGRQCILVESDFEYFEVASDRLSQGNTLF